MQAAAIPASLEAHRAAAAAALAPSQLLPEDRRPFVEALSRAALVAAAQRRRLVGRGKHGASGSTARISMRYHDLSYDAAHLTEAVLEEALDLLSDATAQHCQQRSWVLDKLSDVYMGLTLKEDVEEQEEHDARPVPVGGHDVALCANLGTMLAVGGLQSDSG